MKKYSAPNTKPCVNDRSKTQANYNKKMIPMSTDETKSKNQKKKSLTYSENIDISNRLSPTPYMIY